MLVKTTMRYLHGGRIAQGAFTTAMLIRTTAEPERASVKAFHDGLVARVKPLLNAEFQIYSVTTSPVAVPGQAKKTRNDHWIDYYSDAGTNAQAADVDIALLSTSAEFFKYPTRGTAGSLYLRGTLTEAQLKSDDQGAPDVEAANWRVRYETFATNLPVEVAKIPGGKLVMPGPSVGEDEEPVTPAAYEASAREVERVEFERIVERQVSKPQRSTAAKRIDVLNDEIKFLRRSVSIAKRDAEGEAGGIPAPVTAELNALGHAIFLQYTASERQHVRIEKALKTYIK